MSLNSTGRVAVAGLLAIVPLAIAAWAFAYSTGQTTINGALSVSPDPSGSVRLTMTVCSGDVDLVELYDQRRNPVDRTEPDKPVGIWRRATPATIDDVLVFGSPGSGWKVELDPGQLEPGALYDALAWSSSENTELSQVDFDPGLVAALPAGRAIFHDYQPVQAGAVRASACG